MDRNLDAASSPPIAVAVEASTAVIIDGRLDDTVWGRAPAFPLQAPALPDGRRRDLEEAGEVRFAWDADCLYVGARLVDSDIVAEGRSDSPTLHDVGDVVEIFLKPDDDPRYWEFHVSPANHRAALFFPGRGRLGLHSCAGAGVQFRSAVVCDGTLNDWRDRDRAWTVEIAIPFASLSATGDAPAPKSGSGLRWRLLVGRYNYSRYVSTRGPELSSFPGLSAADFHRHEEYALIEWAH